MKCRVSTGQYVDDVTLGGVNDCGLAEAPVDPNVLFDPKSTSIYSRSFNVSPNEIVVLSACSTCGGCVQVERLMITKPNIPVDSEGSCGCDLPTAWPETICSTDQCGWTLCDCAETRIIAVPGTYRLRVTEEMLGCVTVTMERIPRGNTPVPNGMVFGACPATC
jgi:hypothetical protein